jgi:hypothetical protein
MEYSKESDTILCELYCELKLLNNKLSMNRNLINERQKRTLSNTNLWCGL